MNKHTNILIVGLGLLGGSYAKKLQEEGYSVLGLARRQETIDYALLHNFITEGSIENSIISKADIIICCLYPSIMIEWIKEHKHLFKENAMISDISGVKTGIVDVIQDILDNTSNEFIATHPMAGKESSGIEHADSSMFINANFIIVPTKKNTDEAIQAMKRLANVLDFKHISVLNAQEHDKMIGFLSQLTHVIAVSLMNTHDNEHFVEYTGDSFRDLTRIAKINEHMWSELFLYNKDILLEEIDAFMNSLSIFREALDREDIKEMKELFIQSTARRSQFDK